jgi:hypothetical protein
MCLSLLLQAHHTIPQCLFIPLDFPLLFLLVLAVDPIPFQRILRRIVFVSPIRDVSSDESAPELSIFATDLRRAELDLVELFGGLDALEDGTDFPVLERANICQASGGISWEFQRKAGCILRMFLMQALVHKSMSDMEGILVGKSGIFGLAGRVEQRFAMLNKSLSLS